MLVLLEELWEPWAQAVSSSARAIAEVISFVNGCVLDNMPDPFIQITWNMIARSSYRLENFSRMDTDEKKDRS